MKVLLSYPEFSKKNDIKITSLLKFFDEGHDIMIFANKDVGTFLRKFVNEFGVDFDDYVYIVKNRIVKLEIVYTFITIKTH
jgi:hypothetical protein